MWQKTIFLIILFYFFAILQNSFLVHFSFYGALPNIILILFFCLVFFGKRKMSETALSALLAGLSLDIFSSAHFGSSVIILLFAGFLLEKIIGSLNETKGSKPFIYFAPLFITFFAAYELLLQTYFWFFNSSPFANILSFQFAAVIIYNLLVSCLFFYVFKKYKFLQQL